ncbi:MAG: acyltransferase [Filimonas sp.]|nr:acyltransferase [Filimonas sp.]
MTPLKIEGYTNIFIGDHVLIQEYTWLAAIKLTNADTTILKIGDGTNIGHFNHIYATKEIVFGRNVLTADKVYVSDNLHAYENIALPIIEQPIKQLKGVSIGDGAWIGENVCIIGASVGKGSVIGANSVVTKDIPEYCVAVGSPAIVIKRYCKESGIWRKTDKNGLFLI